MLKKILTLALACCLTIPLFTACSGTSKTNTVVIASKNFTEQEVLAEIMAQMIEKNSNIKVQRKLNMGGTLVCFEAIKKGQIDMYPEYTGTALMEELKLPVDNNPDVVYKTVSSKFESQYQISWLKPLGFNDTYALALPSDIASKNSIDSISDLIQYANNYTFGAEQEFFNRDDGYPGLIKAYGLKFKGTLKMDASLKYQAISQGKIQVTDAFTTDGQLKALKLKLLKDDKNFFPPYYAAPIVRDATLKKYPQIKTLLNKLAGTLDEDTMQELNYKADNEKQSISKVASHFLKEKGLIE